MKTETHQEVRVKLDVSVTVRTIHDTDAVHRMVLRACEQFMPNNPGALHSVYVAEEADIYGGNTIKWTCLHVERFK